MAGALGAAWHCSARAPCKGAAVPLDRRFRSRCQGWSMYPGSSMRCTSFRPLGSNRRSSTFSACSENRAKLTPSPSHCAPRGQDRPGQTKEMGGAVSLGGVSGLHGSSGRMAATARSACARGCRTRHHACRRRRQARGATGSDPRARRGRRTRRTGDHTTWGADVCRHAPARVDADQSSVAAAVPS